MAELYEYFPCPGDALFRIRRFPKSEEASIRKHLDNIMYASGYKRAADQLVHNNPPEELLSYSLTFPIVFLYRHFIELHLKEIRKKSEEVFPTSSQHKVNHCLTEIWSDCRQKLDLIWPKESMEHLEAVSDCLNEFEQLDPHATAFRYPVDRKGQPSFQVFKSIDLRHMADMMRLMQDLFFAIYGTFDYVLEQREESELRACYAQSAL